MEPYEMRWVGLSGWDIEELTAMVNARIAYEKENHPASVPRFETIKERLNVHEVIA